MRLSYRRRRRLVALTVFALVAGGIAAATVFMPEGQRLDRGPTSPPRASAAALPQRRPVAMHLTAAEVKQLRSTIALFVSTSVMRHHPERSWAIVHPVMRQGLTKRQWSTGNIPVVPFPAVGVDLFTPSRRPIGRSHRVAARAVAKVESYQRRSRSSAPGAAGFTAGSFRLGARGVSRVRSSGTHARWSSPARSIFRRLARRARRGALRLSCSVALVARDVPVPPCERRFPFALRRSG
jgi:hypothetical protein